MIATRKIIGKVVGVFIGSDVHSLVTIRQLQVNVLFSGFEGDKHSGMTRLSDGRTPYYPRGTEIRNDRQVSIISMEELEQIALEMGVPQILAEWLGANLVLADIPRLSQLPASTRLAFSQGAVLVVTRENFPCNAPGKVLSDRFSHPELVDLFPIAAYHKRGLVACVEKEGVIVEGDEVTVEIPEQVIYMPEGV